MTRVYLCEGPECDHRSPNLEAMCDHRPGERNSQWLVVTAGNYAWHFCSWLCSERYAEVNRKQHEDWERQRAITKAADAKKLLDAIGVQ